MIYNSLNALKKRKNIKKEKTEKNRGSNDQTAHPSFLDFFDASLFIKYPVDRRIWRSMNK